MRARLDHENGWLRPWLVALTALLAVACSDGSTGSGGKADVTAAADAEGGQDDVLADVGTDASGEDTAADGEEVDAAPQPLALKEVDPSSGKAAGNQPVVIYGTGFEAGCEVLFDGTPLDPEAVFFVDSTELQVQTPPHAPGLASITVINPPPAPGQPSPSATLADAYLFYNDVVITTIDPATGPIYGGTPITISGTGFEPGTKVLVGGKPALGVTIVADDEVLAVTPPGVFGSAPVHVVNSRGVALRKDGFFYTAAPTVLRVQPAAGPSLGGNEVWVEGTGFVDGMEVRFGAAIAAVLEIEKGMRARVLVPSGAVGAVDVRVTTQFGTFTLAKGYAYTDDQGDGATAILTIAPAAGPLGGGQLVTLAATGLIGKNDTTVLFGGQLAKIQSIDPVTHTLTVKTPKSQAAGKVDVTLLTSKGTATAKDGYDYLDQLTVDSVAPAFGPPAGNTKIVLKGSGFDTDPKPVVRVGALPASTVVVVSDAELQAVTPPGAPGYVDVAVEAGGQVATAIKAFAYTGEGMALHVVYPDNGAQAGGTQVHVYGNGFGPKSAVFFDDKPATHVVFVDPTHLLCKTPPGKTGTVTVKVASGSDAAQLKNGFTYFNPMSKYGGTWGAEVDGAVNITVLDASNGSAIPDAFTMLWTDPTTPHQGFTDGNGQITFSGDDVFGVQMISASKQGYESASVIKFDATNVTIFLQPIPPPSPGSPPSGPPPPIVSGKVIGLDKYVIIPTGNCNEYLNKANLPTGTCGFCSSNATCTALGATSDFGCVDIGEGNGKRCVQDCSLGQACGQGFYCQPQTEGPARCVPKAGEPVAVCYHSKPTFLSRENYPPVGQGFEATPQNNFSYSINTAFGEMAIVCFGGYKKEGSVLNADDANSMLAFTPTVMGVKRHLMVGPGENPTDVHIALNMPLSRKATARLDNPITWDLPGGGYILGAGIAYLVFGSDGVVKMPLSDQKFLAPFTSTDPHRLEIERLPAAFSGELFDASLTVLGLVVQISGAEQMPVSATVLKDVKKLNNDDMVRRVGKGDVESVETGVSKTIHGMWGTAPNNVFAVGDGGGLFHYAGLGWTQQANFTDKDLRGIHGLSETQIWAVGQQGSAAAFDGFGWSAVPIWPTTSKPNFNAVFAAKKSDGKPDVWAVGQSGTYRLQDVNGTMSWKAFSAPYINAFSVHGTDDSHIWSVGMQGKINFWDGTSWKAQNSSTSIALRAVVALAADDAWAVGEAGIMLHWNGTKWTSAKSVVKETLFALWANGKDDIWAAGGRGTLLHYDGSKWKTFDLGDQHKALYAVWAGKDGDLLAMGEQELLLGPILYPPMDVAPKKNGTLTGTTLEWAVAPESPEPHFNYVTIGIPGMGGDTPVWNIISAGDLTQAKLPDFPNIQGTPGIPKGEMLRLTMIRAYKEGFDIDAYDLTDLNNLTWRSWSFNSFLFMRQ